MAASSMAARSYLCELHRKPGSLKKESPTVASASSKPRIPETPENVKTVLLPRLCNLRAYGAQSNGLLKTRGDAEKPVSSFFDSLSAYIDNSRKSELAEILSGRLAMIVFAAAVAMEIVTGNSLFRKVDAQGIIEAGGVYIAVVACAAGFAFFSTARRSVGKMFTLSCSSLVDSLIDNLIDGLFYEDDYQDWLDDM